MAGRGSIGAMYSQFVNSFPSSVRDRTHVYQNETWKQRPDEPLHNDKPDKVGVGPGLAAALTIARAFPGLNIGIIPTAFGGSEINRWLPTGDLYLSASMLVQQALGSSFTAASSQTTTPPTCIVMWHQGESDCTDDRASEYESKLRQVVQHFSVLLQQRHNSNAVHHRTSSYFIMGELGTFCDKCDALSGVGTVQHAIQQVSLDSSLNVRLVTSSGLCDVGDSLHFDTPSALEFGVRYGQSLADALHKDAEILQRMHPMYDFATSGTAAAQFNSVDDRVMGGQSHSVMDYNEKENKTTLSGMLALEGGGFISLRACSPFSDLSNCTGVILDVCSGGGNSNTRTPCPPGKKKERKENQEEQGKSLESETSETSETSQTSSSIHMDLTWKLGIRLRTESKDGVYWSATFSPKRCRSLVVLPFNSFVATHRGRNVTDCGALDICDIGSFSLMLAKSNNLHALQTATHATFALDLYTMSGMLC